MAAYQYTELPIVTQPNTDSYIRLVTLLPGEKEGEISCSIAVHQLSQSPQYEAVSYCWGDPANKTQIKLDGEEKLLSIPSNLNSFLLCMRAKGPKRTLWVDSVCIDQTNNEEKSRQVQLMCEIYRRATRTLIWLGVESVNSTAGLALANRLYKASQSGEKKNGAKRSWWPTANQDQLTIVPSKTWKAFFDLFNRPWFTRAWVVQEVVVSSNLWIVCGDKVIHWSVLVGAFFHVVLTQAWVFEYHGMPNLNVFLLLQLSQQEYTQGLQTMHYEVLLRHREAQASDARDHIFAFYGLSCRVSLKRHGIEPDYNVGKEQIYRRLAIATLEEASNLDFLSIPRLTRTSGLPSWVPDWSCSEPVCFSLLQLEMRHTNTVNHGIPAAASNQSTYSPVIDEANDCLEVSGYVFDAVTSISQQWILQKPTGNLSIRAQAMILQANQVLVHDWENVTGAWSGAEYPTGESMYEVTWQTLVVGTFLKTKEEMRGAFNKSEKRQWYLRLLHKLRLGGFVWAYMLFLLVEQLLRLLGIPNPEITFRTLVPAMISRRAAMTEKGFVGMVAGIAQAGDRVALFKGGKLPFVIRPKGDSGWELIGDCYIHGIMHGEAWDEAKCRRMKII